MPYLETAQAWLTQSTLLLRVHPTTTRISTKYNIEHEENSPHLSKRAAKRRATKPKPVEGEVAPPAIRATLTLKTYDSVSGASLKYSTNKAAEVSRLIQILGRLARPMAGLPEIKDDEGLVAAEGEAVEGTATPVGEQGGAKSGPAPAQGQAPGGKKGKKKGKK